MCFHLPGHCPLVLLPFCNVEQTIALQKVMLPYFCALHAGSSVVLQSRTSSNHRPLWEVSAHTALRASSKFVCSWCKAFSASRHELRLCNQIGKPCTPLLPGKVLETGLDCTPASCICRKRGANAMGYLRYRRRRKKVLLAGCPKGCKQSLYETHAAQNLGKHEQSYNTNGVAENVSKYFQIFGLRCNSRCNAYYNIP